MRVKKGLESIALKIPYIGDYLTQKDIPHKKISKICDTLMVGTVKTVIGYIGYKVIMSDLPIIPKAYFTGGCAILYLAQLDYDKFGREELTKKVINNSAVNNIKSLEANL